MGDDLSTWHLNLDLLQEPGKTICIRWGLGNINLEHHLKIQQNPGFSHEKDAGVLRGKFQAATLRPLQWSGVGSTPRAVRLR